MKKTKLLDTIAYCILTILISYSLCQSIWSSFCMTEAISTELLGIIVIISILLIPLLYNKMTTLIGLSTLFIGAIAYLFYLSSTLGTRGTFNFLDNYTFWIIDTVNGYLYEDRMFILLTEIFIALFVTLLIYIFTVKFFNIYVIAVLGCSLFLSQIMLDYLANEFSFYLFIGSFILFYLFDVARVRAKKSGYSIKNKVLYLIYILPVCLITLIVTNTMSFSKTPVEFAWVNDRITSIENYFAGTRIESFDSFSLSGVGFNSKGGLLGGNINPDNVHVMNVRSSYSNIYLKAFSPILYDGKQWYNTNTDYVSVENDKMSYVKEINEDVQEYKTGTLIRKAQNSDLKSPDSGYEVESDIDITFMNMRTRSIFIPAKTNQLTFKQVQPLLKNNEGTLLSPKAKEKDFKYSVTYTNLNLTDTKFIESIRKSHRGMYADKKKSNSNINFIIEGGTSDLDTLIERSDNIYNTYLTLPNTIPQRVYDLAEQITKNSTNDYDKAKAIENYLSTNYVYTLKPGRVPRNKDFVDYFLFDNKKGYCTYYASSMVVMLRSIGIPARYVEGYILPPTANKGIYKVTSKQAHAWVEVYFEGFGWIQFEPTSPFVANMYEGTNQPVRVDSSMSGANYVDYLEMIKKYGNKQNNFDIVTDNTNIEDEGNNNNNILIIVISLLTAVILTFVILTTKNILKHTLLFKKIRKANPNKAVLMSFEYMFSILSIQDLAINAAETPSQYGFRVEKFLDFRGNSFNKFDFSKVMNYFITARYTQNDLSEEEKLSVLNCIQVLLIITKQRIGKRKYYFMKLIRGKI